MKHPNTPPMLDSVRSQNPDAEFILLMSFQPTRTVFL
jgi:hypothetical protein